MSGQQFNVFDLESIKAAQEAMNYLKQRLNGHGGIIVLNAQGQYGIAHNTPRMAWAWKTMQKEDAGVERGNP